MLMKNDILYDDLADIEQIVLDFFSDLYASDNVCIDNDLI